VLLVSIIILGENLRREGIDKSDDEK